ncbi:MAG: thiamine phosphate synthase [Planctomycetaceae bacterium]|nr:thiamine phosphate synthase [Planctomycetaceae bacterium]
MRFDLTPASHRVLERASQLRLQRGMAAVSFAKLLWALFEEEECRAACWLREAELTLEQFFAAFGIQMLESPISAPAFPQGTYGIAPGSYTPPTPSSPDLAATKTDNNAPSVSNSTSDPLPSDEDEAEQEPQDESDEQPQDSWTPTEPPKYSLYSQPQPGRRPSGQSRLQFYFDDQRINGLLLTPELEETLEMVAHRLSRQDSRHSISVSGGVKQIAFNTPAFTLLTEHLLLAVVLDPGNVGNWLRENGLEPTELYGRIDGEIPPLPLGEGRGEGARTCDGSYSPHPNPLPKGEGTIEGLTPVALDCCRLPSAVCRLLDAAANRAREAIRVLEDYVRFILDDAELTQRLKTFRHQFQEVLQQFPMESRLAARNTEHDVGTEITADGEYQRPSVGDLLSANFSRLQESLRSLEEFSKMFDPLIAQQFEQLRYQGYTLHKDVGLHLAGTPPTSFFTQRHKGTEQNLCASVPPCETNLQNAQLYALVNTFSDESTFAQFVTAIIAGGVDIIQLRDKQADDRTLLARSRIVKECIAASERDVLFIMNDRPDLAVLAGADGVHVGQDELPVALVRQIVGNTMLIGVSTHSIDQARQAVSDGADYIGAGPVFESATKEFSQLSGLEYLREVAAEISLPAFAIGGITEDRLDEVLQTGVRRIAVSSALLMPDDPEGVAEAMRTAIRAAIG